ncbi:MAG: HEAT repeat domain-containing protein, partial [Planctomycetales bacterium]|nr:HEAT repeat domain-containing protein [Planctomycetales bacterium]
LLDRDDDPFIKMFCAWALARIAPDNPRDCQRAIPVLIEALGHEQSFVRIEAAATLGMIGPEAKAAIQALEKLNKDPDSDREVREAAAAAIRQIGP